MNASRPNERAKRTVVRLTGRNLARRGRDFLNGYLVLYEDHYVGGDYVTINAFSGNVEVLTLRMVQIRDTAGDLITIPHSSVVNVVNQLRNWSRVDYHVPVDPSADVPKAIEIVRAQIEALATEGDWVYGVGAPIEWIGIDAMTRDAVMVRVSVKTAPLRQFELRRQIKEWVRAAFVQDGIAFGLPPAAYLAARVERPQGESEAIR